MRIAISALAGMTVTLSALGALAEPSPSPPSPPPPGTAPAPEPPPALASPFPEGAEEHTDLAGWRGGFFLRDAHDWFRFYPHLLAEADLNTSFGPGVSDVPGTAGDTSNGLAPRLVLRRARLGFDAEILKRWSVTVLVEFAGGQPLGNASGMTEGSAATVGATPSAFSGRYAPVQTIGTTPTPADVFIGYSLCQCFNVQIGQLAVPFSLTNRTPDEEYPMLEGPVGIRNFVVPSQRDLGGIVWGELGPRTFMYELGVFGGDGQNRPSVDARVDFVGRIFARPFATLGHGDLAKYTQIGVSARHGDRDPNKVAYDAPAITTGQGFVLWKASYTDSLNRLVHVIPSGSQNEIGGELRLQVGRFALQGEAYYVANNTREAVDGYQLTNTERFGSILGVGWYTQLSAWPFGDAFLTPEPGFYRPRHLDLGSRDGEPGRGSPNPSGRSSSHTAHGLEVIALVSGINGSYNGASRLMSTPDMNTPQGDITVYQLGLGANYWHTRHAHFGVYYNAYITPGSGTAGNQAVVPDNLTQSPQTGTPGTGHVLHELSARLAATF